ncbi:MAG: PRC-barrel domain-containing protein [Acetobacteraceae bacterium]
MRSKQNVTFTIAGTMAAAIALPVLAVPAHAGEQLAQAQIQTQTAAGVRADKLVGADVRNAAGDAIGEVESVIIGEDGKVRAVVVSVGGFLGMGERAVALDWRQLHPVGDSGDIAVSMSKEELKALPKYEYAEDRRRGQVYRDPGYLAAERSAVAAQTAATLPAANAVGAGRIAASTLIGAPVLGPRGDTIGEVRDLITEARGNREVVVTTGATLGLGGREVKLALDTLQLRRDPQDAANVALVANLTQDQLASLPAYEKLH